MAGVACCFLTEPENLGSLSGQEKDETLSWSSAFLAKRHQC
jgi:hypothetical protein